MSGRSRSDTAGTRSTLKVPEGPLQPRCEPPPARRGAGSSSPQHPATAEVPAGPSPHADRLAVSPQQFGTAPATGAFRTEGPQQEPPDAGDAAGRAGADEASHAISACVRRAAAGGCTPSRRAHASFSARVLQPQNVQHSTALEQPHPRDSQGNRSVTVPPNQRTSVGGDGMNPTPPRKSSPARSTATDLIAMR
jgi:hypothetical protein